MKFIFEQVSRLPQLSSVDAKIVLADMYETTYGIYNHRNKIKKRPLASVAFQPCEDMNDDSLLEDAVRNYVTNRIQDVFGLSLIEFLDNPHDVNNILVKIAKETLETKNNVYQQVEREFNKLK